MNRIRRHTECAYYSGFRESIDSRFLIETLAAGRDVRIERIVSGGQASPEGFWYDQDEAEWVIILRGQARLRFEGGDNPVNLRPGDYLNIPAHRKHRVEWTSADEPTVWLAVFYT